MPEVGSKVVAEAKVSVASAAFSAETDPFAFKTDYRRT